MKRRLLLGAAALLTLCVSAQQMHRQHLVPQAAIVPAPAVHQATKGMVYVPSPISIGGPEAQAADKVLQRRGFTTEITEDSPFLTVNLDPEMVAESYILDVTTQGVNLIGADAAALMYGAETLTQILDQSSAGRIATCLIEDQPRMGYRGFMIDVVRAYLPLNELKKLVDIASQLKLNTLHLHLTDDNGWRLEIEKYPKLTEVGAWRVDRPEIFPARSNPRADEAATYGGYYTQAQMKELVDYAAERNILVIPEIEMPAHSVAAIASYPELACPVNGDRFIGVLTGIGGKDASIIMCAGRDSTLQFVRDVLDEVMEIFPSQYIHLGGDEANKSHWEKCPLCNARLQELGLNDFEELQGWFMDQINAYVRSKGRTAIGWDEVTLGKPKEDIIIMGWRGDGNAAVNYARETGRRFIMTPAKSTYLIRYQGPQWFEPFTYFGNITLRDAYEFDPVKEDWTPELEEQLMGIQGSMWTEFCRLPADVQYMVFPRLIALADAAWRPAGQSDWPGFIHALDEFLPRLEDQGVNYAKSMYNIQHLAQPAGDGTVTLTAECIRPDATVMVSTMREGKETAMTEAITLSEPTTLIMRSQLPGNRHPGNTLLLDFDFNKATGRTVTSEIPNNGYLYALTNGLRGSLRNSDFEWGGWHNRDGSFVLDLGEEQPISSVKAGALSNANLTIALPKRLRLYGAGEDGNYVLLSEIAPAEDQLFPLTAVITDLDFGPLSANVRYLRVEAENAGVVPDGLPREGTPTWICLDEIIVK